MNVLHINSYDKKGGAETVYSVTKENYLTKNFSACIKLDISSEELSISLNNWENNNRLFGVINYVYSIKNNKKIKEFLNRQQIDIIHLHGFFAGLSPSILSSIKNARKVNNIKIVQTMHDFHMICPNASLYNYSKYEICEKCIGRKYKTDIFFENCDRRGYIYSFVKGIRSIMANNVLHHKDCVDCFIAPSSFLKTKLLEDGISNEKICELRYPVRISEIGIPYKKENIICYFGRLSKEKNVLFLLRAFSEWKNKRKNDFKLLIIGSGEEEENVLKFISNSPIKNDFILKNHLPHHLLNEEIKSSKYSVMASTWYENSPMSILESYALNILPIVPNLGGMAESIKDILHVGRAYMPGDMNSLIDSLDDLETNYDNELAKIIEEKEEILFKLTVDNYYKSLFEIYSNLQIK